MWNLPRPGIEFVSPALAGGFLTTREILISSFYMNVFVYINEVFLFSTTVSFPSMFSSPLLQGDRAMVGQVKLVNTGSLLCFTCCEVSFLVRNDAV